MTSQGIGSKPAQSEMSEHGKSQIETSQSEIISDLSTNVGMVPPLILGFARALRLVSI